MMLVKMVQLPDKIIKWGVCLLVFLLPLFFLPWNFDVLEFSKQQLLFVLTLLVFLVWIVRIFLAKEITIKFSKIHIAVLAFLLVYLLSTIFSVYPYGSFWGWPQPVQDSLSTVIFLVLFYFLVSQNFSSKEVLHLFAVMAASAFLVSIYGILQLLGFFIVPYGFAKNQLFNTIGPVAALGIFLAVLLPLVSLAFVSSKNILPRFLFLTATLSSLVFLILLNHRIVWLAALASSLLTVAFLALKRSFSAGLVLILPVFLLATSLFFVIFGPQFKLPGSNAAELSLSHQESFKITLSQFQNNPASTALGTGPGTFFYNFTEHKTGNINKSSFWNTKFKNGSSKIITDLSTIGFLGMLAFLAMILTAKVSFLGIQRGFKGIWKNFKNLVKEQKSNLWAGAALTVLLSVFFAYFLRSSNVSLDFIFFLSLGSLAVFAPGKIKKINLASSPAGVFSGYVVFTIAIVLMAGFFFFGGQRSLAQLNYGRGVAYIKSGEGEKALEYLKKAADREKGLDFYQRELAILYADRAEQAPITSQKITVTEDVTLRGREEQILQRVDLAMRAINQAIEINPKSVHNWTAKGFICQKLSKYISDYLGCIEESYLKAAGLEKTNPDYYVKLGNVYLEKAVIAREAAEKEELFAKSQNYFEKSVELKPDYLTAWRQLALLARFKQNKEMELSFLKEAQKRSPNNVEIIFGTGLAYYHYEDWQLAKEQFERAIAIMPNYSDALYYYGLTLENLGHNEKAKEIFLRVLELNPGNEMVQKKLEEFNNE